jgi:hypothetical protein
MPHPYWLQNAIRRNPRSAGPGEPIAAPPEFDEAADRDGVPVAPVQTKPQRKKRPIRREVPYWAIGRKPAMEWLEQNGFPEPGDGGQADLERYVADVLAGRGIILPSRRFVDTCAGGSTSTAVASTRARYARSRT